jgi:hypothetical protein
MFVGWHVIATLGEYRSVERWNFRGAVPGAGFHHRRDPRPGLGGRSWFLWRAAQTCDEGPPPGLGPIRGGFFLSPRGGCGPDVDISAANRMTVAVPHGHLPCDRSLKHLCRARSVAFVWSSRGTLFVSRRQKAAGRNSLTRFVEFRSGAITAGGGWGEPAAPRG